MNDWQIIIFALMGKVIIYTVQKFPPLAEAHSPFVKALVTCDFCLGVWIFTALSAVSRWSLLGNLFYFPAISEIMTGCAVSFLVHLASIGWKEKFSAIVIE